MSALAPAGEPLMTSYYNEIDPFAAEWLRGLIAEGLIADGEVDTRSIRDVRPADLAGFDQCHFFAGLGGWPYALRLAGWPDDRPVWTGSCPCQPFSIAGAGSGFADERHLWPDWFWLISQRRPGVIFGEQVESPDARVWLDLVLADLEGCDYACGPLVFPSAGVGAPNIRHRFWWVAESESGGRREHGHERDADCRGQDAGQFAHGDESAFGRLADAESNKHDRRQQYKYTERPSRFTDDGRLGDAGDARLPHPEPSQLRGQIGHNQGRATEQPGGPHHPWSELEWLRCTDGKLRPTQPGLFPLAPRLPGYVGQLRAAGNAINCQAAAEVVRAYMDLRRGADA